MRSALIKLFGISCALAIGLVIGLAYSSAGNKDSPTAEIVATHPFRAGIDQSVLIMECLSKNHEAVLFQDRIDCAPYRKGEKHLNSHAQSQVATDLAKVCPENAAARTLDARRLTADTITALANHRTETIGPHGIRIFGAVFCEAVNLVGLDLPYSLVIDRAVFPKGIEIRNVRTKGDLSLDKSHVFGHLKILRSRIERSFFADETFFENMSVMETTIEGSASMRESILFGVTQFDSATISRELSIRGSALSYFVTQFSRIGGLLDLSHSQARCAYHINKSEIGFIVAKQAGFGVLDQAAGPGGRRDQYAWNNLASDKVKRLLQLPDIAKATSRNEPCITEYARPNHAEFFIFDSKITSSLCINDFQWLAPGESALIKNLFSLPSQTRSVKDHLLTEIALNGNTIGNNLILDLWNKDNLRHDDVSADLHRLEIIGVKADALIIDFDDNERKYRTSIDGLDFNRVYDSDAACEFGGSEKVAIGDRKLTIITDFRAQLQLPKEERVFHWLALNDIRSSQPYTAFAAAFENVGADSTRLKVARAKLELCERAARWGPESIVGYWCGAPANHDERRQPRVAVAALPGSTPAGQWVTIGDALATIVTGLSDFVVFVFQATLSFVADHGHRPGKVIWWVSVTLLAYWVVFFWWFRVIAFAADARTESEKANPENVSDPNAPHQLRPLGLLFLFDRLLPGYHISGANYRITRYYKRIPTEETPQSDTRTVRRLFMPWRVAPVTDQSEIAVIERSLTALRLIGLVFALFLGAAVGQLIVK